MKGRPTKKSISSLTAEERKKIQWMYMDFYKIKDIAKAVGLSIGQTSRYITDTRLKAIRDLEVAKKRQSEQLRLKVVVKYTRESIQKKEKKIKERIAEIDEELQKDHIGLDKRLELTQERNNLYCKMLSFVSEMPDKTRNSTLA